MSLKPVVLQFMLKGMPEVQRALRNIGDTMVSIERRTTVSARKESSERVRTAEREVQQKVAAWQRSERMAAMARASGTRSAEVAARADARALQTAIGTKVAALKKLQDAETSARAKTIHGSTALRPGRESIRGASASSPMATGSPSRSGTDDRKEREYQALLKTTERWTREAEHGEVAAKKSAAREKAAVDKQVAKDKVDAQKSGDRMVREAERQGARDAEKIARDKARTEDSIEREKNRNAMRWVRTREREIASEKKQAAREVEDKRDQFHSTIRGAAGGAVASTFGFGARVAGSVLGMGGGLSIEDSIRTEMTDRGKAAGIISSTADSELGGHSTKSVHDNAKKIAAQYGLDTADVLAGIDETKKLSGNLGTAVGVMPKLAEVATATGADLGQLGGLAGNIIAANPKISNEKLMQQVRLFTQQGMVGGVEIGDMAKFGGRITAGAQYFGGDLEKNEATLGAFAQIARQKGGAASAAEAAMGAQRFATDISGKHDKLKKLGIETSDGKGKLRDPMEIMLDMVSKTGGDVTKFKQLGLGERGIKPLTGVADTYKKGHDAALAKLDAEGKVPKAAREKLADEAGRQSVREDIFKFSNRDKDGKEILTDAAVEAKAKARLQEADKQLAMATQKLRNEIASHLYPHFVKLIPHLARMTPVVARVLDKLEGLISWAEQSPFTAFAGLVTAKFVTYLAQELIAAKIGDLIKKMISGGGGGGVPGGGIPGGNLGKGLAVVGAGIVAGELTKEWVDDGFNDEKKKDDARRERQVEAGNLANLGRHGQLTPEQAKRAKELTGQLALDKKAMDQEMDPENASTVKRVTGVFGAVVGGKDFEEAQQVEQREQMRAEAATTEAMNRLLKAIEENTRATAAAAKGNGGGGGDVKLPPNPSTPITKSALANR